MNYGCSSDKHQDRREMTAGAGVSEEEDGGEGVAWTGSRPVLAGGGGRVGEGGRRREDHVISSSVSLFIS